MHPKTKIPPKPKGNDGFRGNKKKKNMAKVQQISDMTKQIPFTEYDFYQIYEKSFEKSELGRIKSLIPLTEMAMRMGLKQTNPSARKRRGRKSYFSPEGKIALLYLKMYTGESAPKLMEQLNANIHYQLFCGIRIRPDRPLTNYKLLNDSFEELADLLKIKELQFVLADKWRPLLKNLDTVYMDGTCYESVMRYPTDVKLLWESIEKAYAMMVSIAHQLGEHRMRTKYIDIAKDRLAYVKQRKHTKEDTRHITQRMLALLGKLLNEIRRQQRKHPQIDLLKKKELVDLETITKVYRQQKNHFESSDAKESIPDRIVSINKPYVRPIVRGKEVKQVEFGAKCNNVIVDGISFIDKLSFNAFNEGKCLKSGIKYIERLLKTKIKKVGGDQGYSSNENRKFCATKGIVTSFAPKGKANLTDPGKTQIRKELARVRATTMEGSFGTQKEHYNLKRVNARRKKTEILLIFFGIHTANAVLLAKRVAAQEKNQKAA